jgi:hypothetical protein
VIASKATAFVTALATAATVLAFAAAPAHATITVDPTTAPIASDEAPTEIEPEPEQNPDQTIPAACRGYTIMGEKPLWDSGLVIDPVSKQQIFIGNPINWRTNPTQSRSWPIYLHGLAWARGYVDDFIKTGNQDSLNKAIEIARSHDANVTKPSREYQEAWSDHPVSLRLNTLACIAAITPLPNDLQKMLNQLAKWQMDDKNYFRRHNHGLMQNVSLVRAGCQQAEQSWVNTAWRRMKDDFEFAVNSSGVNNEQATGYAFFNWRAWDEALNEIEKCDLASIPPETRDEFNRRLALLADFNAHATQPDGQMIPIGDTLVNRIGITDRAQLPTTAIYQDGYVFGRSSWQDPNAMHWSLRFGPKPRNHGHDDHLAVTYLVDGTRVLIDGAHAGYDQNSDRAYLISKAAHNTPVVTGAGATIAFQPGTSQLISNYADETRAVVTVRDKQHQKKDKPKKPLRTRTVVADYPSKTLVTLDRATGPTKKGTKPATISVPWAFNSDFTLNGDQVGRVTATHSNLERVDKTPTLHAFDPQNCQPLSIEIGKGRSALGWRQLTENPRAVINGTQVLTVISPGAATVQCVIETGTTALTGTTTITVTSESGQTTQFIFDPTNGLR